MTTKIDKMDLRLSRASLQDMDAYSEKVADAEARVQSLLKYLKQIETVSKAVKAHGLAATPGRRNDYLTGKQARDAASVDRTIFDGSDFGRQLNQTKQRVNLHRQILGLSKQQQAIQLAESRTLTNSQKRIEKIKDVERAKLEILAAEYRITDALHKGDTRRLNNATSMKQKLEAQLKVLKDQAREASKLAQEQQRQASAKPKPTDAMAAARSRRLTQQRLFGDGGAALFQIQTGLLANYMALNQLRTGFVSAIQFSTELDEALRNLQAIVRITDNNMVGLKESIIATSEATKFTAVEVAQAAVTLGQAGLSVREIEEALKAVTLLATATGTDLPRAVDIATSTLGVFNMEAGQMGHVANVMTEAVNSSKLNIEKLTLGLQYSGNIASQSGVQFEELTAALGAMANAGIRSGSTLGTGTRQVLIALQKPSEKYLEILKNLGLTTYDVDLKTKSLYDVMKTLKDAGFSSADAIHAFEVRAAAAFNALQNNLNGMLDLEDSFIRTEAASQANETQMRSLSNQWKRFGSVLGSVVSTGMEPMLLATRDALKSFSDWLEALRKNGPELRKWVSGITALVTGFVAFKAIRLVTGLVISLTAALLPSKAALAGVATAFTVTQAAGGTLAATLGALKVGFLALIPGIGQILALAGAVGAAWYATRSATQAYNQENSLLTDAIDRQETKVEESEAAVKKYSDQMGVVDGKIQELINRSDSLTSNQDLLKREVENVRLQFAGMGIDVDTVIGSVGGLISNLIRLRQQLAKEYTLAINVQIGNLKALAALQQTRISEAQIGLQGMDLSGLPAALRDKMAAASRGELDDAQMTALMSDVNTYMAKVAPEAVKSDSVTETGFDVSTMIPGAVYAPAVGDRTKARETMSTLSGASEHLAAMMAARRAQLEIVAAEGEARNAQTTVQQRESSGYQVAERQARELATRINTELADIERSTTDDPQARYEAFAKYAEVLAPNLDQIIADTQNDPHLTAENKERLIDLYAQAKSQLGSAEDRYFDDAKTITQGGIRRSVSRYRDDLSLGMSEIRQADNSEDIGAAKQDAETAALMIMMARKRAVRAEMKSGQTELSADQQNAMADINHEYANELKRIENAAREREQALNGKGGDGGAGASDKRDFNLLMEGFKSRQSLARKQMKTGEMGVAAGADYLDETVAMAQKELEARQEIINKMQAQAAAGALSKNEQKELTRLVGEEKSLMSFIREEQEKILKLREANGLVQFDLTAVVQKFADAALSMRKTLSDGILNVLGSIKSGFVDMWTSFTEGSKSGKEALRDFALTVLKTLNKVIAELLIVYMLKKALGWLFPDAGITMDMSLSDAFGAVTGLKTGGFVRKAAGGEMVPGSLGRDSVPALLMPGEFVMRKSAVDMIGADTLSNLNSMGNRRMAKGGPVDVMGKKQGGLATTNVYVVSPEQKPTLGPNDVIAVISDDMVRGGQTRKLVKSIQSGAL